MDKIKLESSIALGFTHKQLAIEHGCSASNIQYWLEKYGLKTKTKYRDGSGLVRSNRERYGLPIKQRSNWPDIQAYYDQGYCQRDTAKHFHLCIMTLREAFDLGLIIKRTKEQELFLASQKGLAAKRSYTTETRLCLSRKRKAYLAREHRPAWKTSDYHRSKPCEHLKNILKSHGFVFDGEFEPLRDEGRFYSIDIAFISLKLGIEINGRQHYNVDGTLTPYYQERHDLIIKKGWRLIEIPYHRAYSLAFVENLIKELKMVLPSGAAPEHGSNQELFGL